MRGNFDNYDNCMKRYTERLSLSYFRVHPTHFISPVQYLDKCQAKQSQLIIHSIIIVLYYIVVSSNSRLICFALI